MNPSISDCLRNFSSEGLLIRYRYTKRKPIPAIRKKKTGSCILIKIPCNKEYYKTNKEREKKNIAIKAIIHPLFSPSILEIRTIVTAKKIITKISQNIPITNCSVESPIILLTINVNIKLQNYYSRKHNFICIVPFFNKSFVLKGHIVSKVAHSFLYFAAITTIQRYCRRLTKRSFISPISSLANFGLGSFSLVISYSFPEDNPKRDFFVISFITTNFFIARFTSDAVR